MSLFVVEAIRGLSASFMILTATVSEICGGQTNVPISVVWIGRRIYHATLLLYIPIE